ncbi:hypothetical protein DVH05_018225 [Phytophthora capsici]|nr:hypothetical protein DVH05_018225 [Phytophthora capsici]
MCLHVVKNKRVPFGFEKLRDQAWKILTGANGHEDFQLTIQNQGDDMFGRRKLDNAVGLCNLLGILPFGNEANKLAIIWEYEGTCTKAPPRHQVSNLQREILRTIFRRCANLKIPVIPDDANLEGSIGVTTDVVFENYKRTVVCIFVGHFN